jgi:hypothetical protein
MMARSGKIKGRMHDPCSDKVTAWLTCIAPRCDIVTPSCAGDFSVSQPNLLILKQL